MKRFIYFFTACLLAFNVVAQTKIELALEALNSGDDATVVQYTTEILAEQPKNTPALTLRASANSRLGNFDAAFSDINAAIKHWRKKYEAEVTLSDLYLTRSYLYVAIGDEAAALADMDVAVKKGGRNAAEYYDKRADFYVERDFYDLAEADYHMAAKKNPDNVDYQVKEGLAILLQGRVEEAEKRLEKLVKLYPLNAEAQRWYAYVFYLKEDYKSSIDQYIKYMAMADQMDLTVFIKSSKQEFDYAIDAITAQMKLENDNYFWDYIRARVYRENRHFVEALTDLKRIEEHLGVETLETFVLEEMAVNYEQLEEFPQSIYYYSILIDQNEENSVAEVYYNLKRANVYCYMGEADKALEDCEKALRTSMDYAPWAYYLKGRAEELKKEYEAAILDYTQSLAYVENNQYAHLKRGKLYLMYRQDTVSAMQDFERVLELDTVVVSSSCRHYALMYLGRTAEAKAWMADILERYSDRPVHYCDAACLYACMGEAEEAMKYLRQGLEMGYRNLRHFEIDSDFDSLRDRPDFKELINTYKQKASEEKRN